MLWIVVVVGNDETEMSFASILSTFQGAVKATE